MILALVTLVAAMELLEVHGPDGQLAYINPHEISSLREPTNRDLVRHFPKRAQCIVTTTDGKFLVVVEACPRLRDRLTAQ